MIAVLRCMRDAELLPTSRNVRRIAHERSTPNLRGFVAPSSICSRSRISSSDVGTSKITRLVGISPISNSTSNSICGRQRRLGVACPTARQALARQARYYWARGADSDTIFALATSPGRSAVAIIRIAGSACLDIYSGLCPNKSLPAHRQAAVRTLYDPLRGAHGDAILDSQSLVLYFAAPNSATGDDVLELHVHGGPAIVRAVLQAIPKCLSRSSVIRHAEPGEFTRRAFLNHRLDLTQAEALGDLLSATTERQRKLSIRGASGTLAKLYEQWRAQVLDCRGELEALIDFSEDQHFEESPSALAWSVARKICDLGKAIRRHVTVAARGDLLRHGIKVALLGAPNAGKSSLLNCIVGRDAAIVSEEAGTTRDVVEVVVDLSGYLCRFGDTAGLRTFDERSGTNNAIEEQGIMRAIQYALKADVVVVVTSVDAWKGQHRLVLDSNVIETAQRCAETGTRVLAVINKSDLLASGSDLLRQMKEELAACLQSLSADSIAVTSCSEQSASDVQPLVRSLTAAFADLTSAFLIGDELSGFVTDSDALGASERHRFLLEDCLAHFDTFFAVTPSDHSSLGQDTDIVVAAEALRAAADSLARITGRGDAGDVEEVLGIIFQNFCIGK